MKRRRFLLLTAGGLVVAGSGAGLWLHRDIDERERPAEDLLFELAKKMVGAAVIGRAWLDSHPNAEPAQELLRVLELAGAEVLSPGELAERIADQVEADLATEQLFRHEGWWLSVTEAQLAALHVALLGDRASEPEEPSFETADEARIVRLEGFAPERLRQDQPLAHPGLPERVIWFATGERPPPRLVVMLAGERMVISARDTGFSVRLRPALIERLQAEPGEYDIWLYDPIARQRQLLGRFVIEGAEKSNEGFCRVDNWGPRETAPGVVFNEQPDGSAAFWIQIRCFPRQTVVVFDNVELPTTLRPGEGLITARVPDPTLYASPGEYRLELLDRDSGATQPVGKFTVHE